MRYSKQNIFANEEASYKRLLEERGLKLINHYDTPKFKYPEQSDMSRFSTIQHIWKVGDRYYKLAYEYYSDPKMWWVIAFFNQKPTESHVNLGDTVYIPTPLETALFYMGY
jgi:hypothetical protein